MPSRPRAVAAAVAAAVAVLAALALPLYSAGCADPPARPGSVTVVHWWTAGGEAEALAATLALFTTEHPSDTWVDGGVTGTTEARKTITRLMLGGQPPGIFQANGGWDLLQWVLYNNLNVSQNKMDYLDDVAVRQDWAGQFPEQVLRTVRFGDHTYGVPLNIHRVNTLFYNKQVFADAGLAPPTTLDELFAAAAVFQAREVIPIALGSNDPWTLPLLLFENLMVAREGGGFYREFFRGNVDALGPEITGLVADFDRLLSYTNTNAGLMSWTKAADLVREGKAAMTIMGDWTKAYFVSKALKPDVDFGSIPMPGTNDTFVFTTDTFGLPQGSPDKQTALDLLEVFGSPQGQDVFNPIKGSISPRMDADVSVYKDDAMSQRTIAAFRDAATRPPSSDALVPATAILAPPAYLDAIVPVLAQFALDRNASDVLHTLANYTDMLQMSPLR